MAISQIWYGAFLGVAAWQLFNAALSVLLYGHETKVDGGNVAISLIIALLCITLAFAGRAGVL